jgi:EAL domain-containing protein (putative c-di-GMP-specific phosphodiesterase class I)
MLCVPLRGPAGALGVLKVASAKADAFGDDDVAVLEALAPFIATTVATASDLARIVPGLAGLSGGDGAAGGERRPHSSLSYAQEKAVTRFLANVLRPGLADELDARQTVLSALAPDAMVMFAQPIYHLDEGFLWGVEALARFRVPPSRPPDKWFGEAHRLGLGVELELAAIRKGLELLRAVPSGVHVTVNLGPQTMCDAHLDELLEAADPGRVVLELTEHIEIDDYPALRSALNRYRRRGVKLAVDDAGSGISGLTHILRLAPDYIKLDRELTRGVEVDPVRRSLAAALVKFASESGAEVIAEGIENAEALAVLTDLNVGYGQGYHLGRPAPIAQLKAGAAPVRRGARCLP